jgi:hypothetical protein
VTEVILVCGGAVRGQISLLEVCDELARVDVVSRNGLVAEIAGGGVDVWIVAWLIGDCDASQEERLWAKPVPRP